jgi:HAD superfamily hydrolase (TIGR01459 family)
MHDQPAKAAFFSPRLIRGLSELAADYDLILCDVWGVIHNGIAHFGRAVDALARFRRQGGRVILLTNAPRPQAKVVKMLDRLGVPRESYDGVVTSGDVTISLIAARKAAPMAYIGPAYDEPLFAEAERISGFRPPRVAIDKADYVVCTGLADYDQEKPKDYEPQLAAMKARELDFICANPDIVVDVGGTLYYCAGALAEIYAALGGKVIQAGKPYLPIYERALALAADRSGIEFDRKRVLAIGDGLHTDIRGGSNHAIDTLFITSGIHRAQLHGEAMTIDLGALRQLSESHGLAVGAVLAELVW